MATPTYTLIGSTVLSSPASSVTFSGISATGKGDLVLVAETDTGAGIGLTQLRFNADAVTECERVTMFGDGSSATSQSWGGSTVEGVRNSSDRVFHRFEIMDYSATDKNTSGVYRGGAAGNQTLASAFRWKSNSAINSLAITSGTNQYQAGSTFHLYQIVSE